MKIIFTILIIVISPIFSTTVAQSIKADSLKVNQQCDMTSAITTNIQTNILYNRTIKWINEYYQNPDRVITGNLENQSITVTGLNPDILNTKAYGANYSCDMYYHIYFSFKETLVTYRLIIDRLKFGGLENESKCEKFYKKDGSIKKEFAAIADRLELYINNLLFSYVNKLSIATLSSEEALSQLKKAKEKLDLQLITQEEYDKIKAELLPYIK